MEPDTLMSAGGLVISILLVYGGLHATFDKKVNRSHQRIDELDNKMQEHQLTIFREYVSKVEMDKLEARMEKKIEESENRIIKAIQGLATTK